LDRRGTSVLLIPLLGFLALLYPIAIQRPSGGQGSTGQRSKATRTGTQTSGKKGGKVVWHGDRLILDEFLGPLPRAEGYTQEERNVQVWPNNDRRQNLTLGFIVATVPDPTDSGLPYLFDRFMSSIQAAIAADDYVLDRFNLPWFDPPEENDTAKVKQGKTWQQQSNSDGDGGANPDIEGDRRFESQPGVILFRRHTGMGELPASTCPSGTEDLGNADRFCPDLLLVYVVGETPTSGVQKNALMAALREIKWFCLPSEQGADAFPKGYPNSICSSLKFMGPAFTGSVPSVEFTLNSWLNSYKGAPKPDLQIISGSATSVETDKNFKFGDEKSHFSATAVPDRVTIPRLLEYFRDMEPHQKRHKVALLIEGNTAYGQSGKETCTAPGDSADGSKASKCGSPNVPASTPSNESQKDSTEVTYIPFPLHISQLRAASEKQRKEQQQAGSQPVFRSPLLELPLEEADDRHDSIRALSELDLPSAEQIVSNLLSTISRDGFRYVGIMATDARDTMFLAQEVHEHNPAAVLFTLNPDLLYLHPEINPATRGMLIFSSYPLFNANQLWSFPNPSNIRLQFPDHAAEGAYNATLVLLDRPDLVVEYGLPFNFLQCNMPPEPDGPSPLVQRWACGPSWPPLWITVVGRDALWPLAYEPIDWRDVSGEQVGPASQKPSSSDPEQDHQPYLRAITTIRRFTEGQDDGSGSNPSQQARLIRIWARGMYPQSTTLAVVIFSFACAFFCLVVTLSRICGSPPVLSVGECANKNSDGHKLGDAGFLKPLGPTVFGRLRQQGELHLLVALMSLGFFQFIALMAFALPAIGLWGKSPHDTWNVGVIRLLEELPLRALLAGIFCIVNLAILTRVTAVLLIHARQQFEGDTVRERPEEESEKSITWHWIPAVAGAICMLWVTVMLVKSWWPSFGEPIRVSTSLFTGLRLLNLQSGVSQLLPIFFISMVGLLWALNSFQRVRLSEHAEGWKGIFCTDIGSLGGIAAREASVQHYLKCPSISLPGALFVITGATVIGYYLFEVRLVPVFDGEPFYDVLGVSFTFLNIALWLGVLRFCLVWRALESILAQLSLHPLRVAYKRYRALFPAMPKIDLTTPSATTASLACSVDQARVLWQTVRSPGSGTGVAATISTGGGAAASPQFVSVFDQDFEARIDAASEKLTLAMRAEAEGRWREALCLECDSQQFLARVSAQVTREFEACEWLGCDAVNGKLASLPKDKCEATLVAGEAYLVTRLVHFLSCVFPQLQNLVYCSAAGLLLMLVAVSSYPLQPRGLLLLFNWAVILTFIGIALLVFVQMNRNVVLSNLNGTKPGQINWDREFVFRLFFYGVVPILALLGAQFPESVGEIITRILPASAGHP
jgi:hypothetical protein